MKVVINFKFNLVKVLVVTCLVFNSITSFSANITPARTDVSGFGTWTDASVGGTTYLQLLSSSSSTISPAMDFTSYTGQTLDFKARTFGGINATNNVITVSISTNNGSSWTVLGTRTPSSSTLTAQTQFDISGYTGTQVKIKFETLGASGSIGAGIDDLTISGTAAGCTAPTTQATSFSTNTVTTSSMNITFTRGNGTAGVLVVARSAGAVDADPSSGTSYTANATFGSGTQIGTGNYVIYNGTAAGVSTASGNIPVSGLSAGTTYYYAIYEYNTTSTCYHLTELTGNQTTSSVGASNTTDYFRSLATGNWNTAGTWESSSDNSTWQTSTLVPTSSAAAITIQTGHTVTINATASAPSITIAGTGKLTFDGAAIRALTMTGDLTISAAGGSFITQSSGTYTNTLSIAGNISNAGTFDMSRGGTTLVCDVTFNKNGNQSVSGTGSTTRFNEITLDMGTSNSNILEISSSAFSAPDGFLETSSGVANRLENGTLKFSGSFTYTGTPFIVNSYNNTIVSTAGIWLNNSNVTITAFNDSYDIGGLFRITAGTFNIGTTNGNSLKFKTGSTITIEGGFLNISGRIQGQTVSSSTTTYNQSGGTVTILTSTSFTGSTAGMDFTAVGSSFTISGGTIILRNETASAVDIYMKCSTTITGGTIQFGDASTSAISPVGYWIESTSTLPSILVYSVLEGSDYPYLKLAENLTISGTITIGTSCNFDVSYDAGTNNYNISLTGNWVNNGTFVARNKTVTFNGIVAQDLSGSTTTGFYNLTLNNTSATGLTFSKDATVAGALTLTDGILYTSNPNYLTMNAGSTSTSGSATSFVDGPMKKIGSTNFVFPVGDGTRWRRVAISSLSGSETFTAQYVNATYSNTSSMKAETEPLVWVSTTEYWNLTRAGAIDAVVELYWEDATASSLPVCSDLRIAHWDNTNNYWEKANIDAVTTTGSCTGTGSGTIYSNADLTEFSPFTFGSVTIVTLPVSLTTFDAVLNGRKADLTWTTETEANNDFFTIEKTKDGVHFEQVATVNGAGNHIGELNYQATDFTPFDGVSYYRLTQTDFDGHSESFPMRSINLNGSETFAVFPNPVTSESSINVNSIGLKNDVVRISILDLVGNTITSHVVILDKNNEMIPITLPLNLSSGVYMCVFTNGDTNYSEKLIIR